MMNQLLSLALAGLAGFGLGLFYFGGLWLTVRQLATFKWPVALLIGSGVVRTTLVLAGFFIVMNGRLERILVCLIGFIAARWVLVSRMKLEHAPGMPRREQEV